MAFTFHELDEETRRLMLGELDLDEGTEVFLSVRLNAAGMAAWPALLRDACSHGDDTTLVAALGGPGGPHFNQFEVNPSTGVADKRVPHNAAAVLGEGEFNRFYIRALCVRATSENKALEVYRARPSSRPDPVSEAKIGDRVDPTVLLADLRSHKGVNTALGIPRPNSGLSVRLV